MNMGKKRKALKKRKVVKEQPQDIVQKLVGEMYDKLAAKMVVALYREKQSILEKLRKNI